MKMIQAWSSCQQARKFCSENFSSLINYEFVIGGYEFWGYGFWFLILDLEVVYHQNIVI